MRSEQLVARQATNYTRYIPLILELLNSCRFKLRGAQNCLILSHTLLKIFN